MNHVGNSQDPACWLLFYLETHGAVVSLTPAHDLHVDLNPLPGLTAETADRLARAILSFREEIRAILVARAEIVH